MVEAVVFRGYIVEKFLYSFFFWHKDIFMGPGRIRFLPTDGSGESSGLSDKAL